MLTQLRAVGACLWLATVIALAACESSTFSPSSSPEVSVADAAPATIVSTGAAVVASATGSGHTIVAGVLRTFSFTARLNADGTASGTAQIDNRAIGEMFQLDIDCMKVVGNVAIMSGVITRHTDVNAVGLTGVFGVMDFGEGSEAPPDRSTQVFFFRPGVVTCQDFGTADVDEFAVSIASGNVQVH